MKKLNKVLLLSVFIVILGCNSNKPETYTTISGLWKCEEIDELASVKIFHVDIDKVRSYDDAFIMSNFHNAGEETFIRVSVTGSKLILPNQYLQNILIEGEGNIGIEYKIITAEYSIEDGGRTANYIATFYR